MTDEVLTIKEIAGLLRLAEKTVYSMAQRGEIPAFKVRGQWRVQKSDLQAWMESQKPPGDRGAREDAIQQGTGGDTGNADAGASGSRRPSRKRKRR